MEYRQEDERQDKFSYYIILPFILKSVFHPDADNLPDSVFLMEVIGIAQAAPLVRYGRGFSFSTNRWLLTGAY